MVQIRLPSACTLSLGDGIIHVSPAPLTLKNFTWRCLCVWIRCKSHTRLVQLSRGWFPLPSFTSLKQSGRLFKLLSPVSTKSSFYFYQSCKRTMLSITVLSRERETDRQTDRQTDRESCSKCSLQNSFKSVLRQCIIALFTGGTFLPQNTHTCLRVYRNHSKPLFFKSY